MKTILLPTDFSDNSFRAACYALSLFEGQSCQFMLVHAYRVARPSGMLISIRDLVEQEANQSLAREVARLKQAGFSVDNVTKVATEGTLKSAMSLWIKRYEASMVIMGTKGASGLAQTLLGSNTWRAIQDTPVPVLAVPESAPLLRPKRVVLAIDSKGVGSPNRLQPIKEILKQQGASATVLTVEDQEDHSPWKEMLLMQVGGFLNGIAPDFKVLDTIDNVEATLYQYLESNSIDLLVLFPRHHTFLERIFSPSTTRDITFHSKIPLFIIPENNSKS